MSNPKVDALLAKSGAKFVTLNGLNTILEPLLADLVKALKEQRTHISELKTELAELKAQPLLKNGGIWRHGSVYTPGDVAQFKSRRWVCTKQQTACGAPDHSCWRLWEKDER